MAKPELIMEFVASPDAVMDDPKHDGREWRIKKVGDRCLRIKVTNRGEWLRKKHGKKARRGWIKVHVAFDLKSKRVIELEVPDERTQDCQKAKELVEGAKK